MSTAGYDLAAVYADRRFYKEKLKKMAKEKAEKEGTGLEEVYAMKKIHKEKMKKMAKENTEEIFSDDTEEESKKSSGWRFWKSKKGHQNARVVSSSDVEQSQPS